MGPRMGLKRGTAGRGRIVAMIALTCALAIAAFTGSASAATTVGAVSGPGDDVGGCEEPINLVQKSNSSGFNYRIPTAGVITAWRTWSPGVPAAAHQIGLQVWRPAGATSTRSSGGPPRRPRSQRG